MMPKIVGVTHVFIYQVGKFNYILALQKGKGVDSNTFPHCLGIPPLRPWTTFCNPGAVILPE